MKALLAPGYEKTYPCVRGLMRMGSNQWCHIPSPPDAIERHPANGTPQASPSYCGFVDVVIRDDYLRKRSRVCSEMVGIGLKIAVTRDSSCLL